MNTIYLLTTLAGYLALIIITAVLTHIVSTNIPNVKNAFTTSYKRVVKRFTRKPRKVVSNDLSALISRIEALETKVSKRDSNHRTFIRAEVKSYLEKLRNK